MLHSLAPGLKIQDAHNLYCASQAHLCHKCVHVHSKVNHQRSMVRQSCRAIPESNTTHPGSILPQRSDGCSRHIGKHALKHTEHKEGGDTKLTHKTEHLYSWHFWLQTLTKYSQRNHDAESRMSGCHGIQPAADASCKKRAVLQIFHDFSCSAEVFAVGHYYQAAQTALCLPLLGCT